MKIYLITGGAGFIGSNFIKHLLSTTHDIKIHSLDCLTYAGNIHNLSAISNNPNYNFINADIRDEAALKQVFGSHNFDYIVNFAAESHVDRSIDNPSVFAETNIIGTLNLLNCAKQSWQTSNGYRDGVKFLQISTDEVYGSLGETGLFTEQTPLSPHSPYSASKASADMFVQAYYDTYKLPVCITRCSNNYGPNQFPEKLIPVIIENALKHKSIPVYGDGKNVRDWLHVADHCRAIEMVLNNGINGEVYNVGGNNEMQNIEIVKLIIGYLNKHDSQITNDLITFVADRKGHDRRYAIDAAKIQRELGWTPQIRFADGIVSTIEWYLSNPEWLENIRNGSYRNA